MIYTIKEISKRIAPVAEKYHLPAVYLFGSYSRNEATENSDVDILTEQGLPMASPDTSKRYPTPKPPVAFGG